MNTSWVTHAIGRAATEMVFGITNAERLAGRLAEKLAEKLR